MPLWRKDDGGICPGGGIVEIGLSWRDDRLAVGNLRVEKAGECGEPLPPSQLRGR